VHASYIEFVFITCPVPRFSISIMYVGVISSGFWCGIILGSILVTPIGPPCPCFVLVELILHAFSSSLSGLVSMQVSCVALVVYE